jgi:hypothetical protein
VVGIQAGRTIGFIVLLIIGPAMVPSYAEYTLSMNVRRVKGPGRFIRDFGMDAILDWGSWAWRQGTWPCSMKRNIRAWFYRRKFLDI